MENLGFNPDLHLDHNERAFVAQTVATPGYGIIHKIMRCEVDKFFMQHMNTDAADAAAVLASHKLSKAAAQFYQAVTNRINIELQKYAAVQGVAGKPLDLTEGLIDMGEKPSTFADLEIDEKLLEEESFDE